MPTRIPINKDDHGSKESESGGGFSRSPSASGDIREKDLSPEEWREVALLLAGHITDLSSEKWREVVSLLDSERTEGRDLSLDEPISPDVTPEEAEVIARRFLSFDPFEGVDTDLSGEEKVRPSREEAANLRRLAGHFAQRGGEIKSLLYKAEAHLEKEQCYTEAAGLACATLREVLEARYLREGVKLLARTRNHYLGLNEAVSVLTHIEEFFEIENRLLIGLDVSSDLATEIIADCRQVFEKVRNGQAPRGQVFEAITRVTNVTCDLAKRLKEKAIQRDHERTKKILKTASKAIGGTALVALNAGVLAAPGTQAFAAFSGVLGAGLIEAAAQEL